MIVIIPALSPDSIRAEADWLARQPRWVQRAYIGFYAGMFLSVLGIVAWVLWTTL